MRSSEPIATFTATISAENVAAFFNAVGWAQPVRPACPPTLATMFREGEFKALQEMKIPLQRVLHGEQKYRFLKELSPGATYSGKTFLNNQTEKAGMGFYVFQTNIEDAGGDVCIECLTTIIVRGK